jgi:hypothetical protein
MTLLGARLPSAGAFGPGTVVALQVPEMLTHRIPRGCRFEDPGRDIATRPKRVCWRVATFSVLGRLTICRVGFASLLMTGLGSCSEPWTVDLPAAPALDDDARERRQRRDRLPREKVLDVAGYQKMTCTVHGQNMHPTVVPIEYGLVHYDSDYVQAFGTLFPFAGDVLPGGCIVGEKTHARVMFCSRCRAAKSLWMAQHPDIQQLGDREYPE